GIRIDPEQPRPGADRTAFRQRKDFAAEAGYDPHIVDAIGREPLVHDRASYAALLVLDLPADKILRAHGRTIGKGCAATVGQSAGTAAAPLSPEAAQRASCSMR